MYAQVNNAKDNSPSAKQMESHVLDNSIAQKKSNVQRGLSFLDNRAETKTQQRLYNAIDNNSKGISLLSKTQIQMKKRLLQIQKQAFLHLNLRLHLNL